MLIVNLYGAPGSGKSLGASYIFSRLKLQGINAELVTEYAKDKVYEENVEVFRNQAYVFGKQYFRTSRLEGKVDVVVTDSPLLLATIYNNSEVLGEPFNDVIATVAKSYETINVLLLRNHAYSTSGRYQSEKESDDLVPVIRDMMTKYGILYNEYYSSEDTYNNIVNDVINYLS